MNTDPEAAKRQGIKAGVGYAILAYATWGLLPLYWKSLDLIPSDEILAHRIFWSFLFVAAVLTIRRRWKNIKPVLTNKKQLLAVTLCSILVTGNWYIYIWAVNHGQVIEAALGYYINPLLSIALGMIVLGERLHFWQLISLGLAAIGVAIMTIEHGRIPWIAVSLALTFALYGLAKKLLRADALTGLALETFMITPFALGYLMFLEGSGSGTFFKLPTAVLLLLICSGIATAIPLLWFARSAQSVPLSMLGFIQYLSPTISLLMGVFLFKEPFTIVHAITFTFLWSSLLLYSLSYTGLFRKKPRINRTRHI
ncbi:EamA family transporter RarD [Brevibacillus massiliensis]|uniref:EamA family transporter RarD n=1 Tax=Brevibacillus massiliensis TaxID=1118054 RepID=UPI00031CAB07|nr:EamA family transporter RarD [Brevibacillus massiliensis]